MQFLIVLPLMPAGHASRQAGTRWRAAPMPTYMIPAGKELGKEVMRMRCVGAVLAACFPVAVAAMDPPEPADSPALSAQEQVPSDSSALRLFKQKLASAEALSKAGNASGAFRAFDAVVHDPGFARLPAVDQRRVLSLAGSSAIDSGKPDRALEFYRRATELESDDPDDWYRLAFLEYQAGALDPARVAMRHLVEYWPELLPNIDAWVVPHLVYDGDRASQARYELMQSLFDANWRDPVAADAVWYQLAIAQAQRGETEAARRTVQRIDEPDAIVRLRADKRFDAIVDPEADAFDPVLVARRKMERLSQAAEAAPDKLDPLVQLSYAMLTLGMHEEVVALADKTIDRIVNAAIGKAPFTDIDRQIWLMNNRSIAYERMGKPMEALAELKRARGFDEGGGVNVSQALNLGMFYCRLQQPRDALAEIAHVGDMSGYGRMVETNVQLCAALELGKREDADAALAYLRQHRDDAPVLLLEGLLRDGRMDEAAALVKTLLADGYKRGDLLDWMQGWRQAKALPGDAVALGNRNALLARADVIAALEPVGRIAPVALYTTGD